MGAAKIFGLDISEGMLKNAREELTELGIADKFELICADMLAGTYEAPEKVDGVIFCYVCETFMNNQEMVNAAIIQGKKWLKDNGYILITCLPWSPNQPLSVFGTIN
jgi:ubiquinone/menaquinone biosynthesis C-methylase UbiE